MKSKFEATEISKKKSKTAVFWSAIMKVLRMREILVEFLIGFFSPDRSSPSATRRDEILESWAVSSPSREMTNILIASEIGLGHDLVVRARGNRIFPRQCFHCRAGVFVCGHYRFTRNQISPRKQLTVEIGVYTRVPIKSILSSAYTEYICSPVADVYLGETGTRFFLRKIVTRSSNMIPYNHPNM